MRVANKLPNPGRYRMLFETRRGRRRLFREGDSFHPAREGGKVVPRAEEIPSRYRDLLEWYRDEFSPQAPAAPRGDRIVELRGLLRRISREEDADAHVARLRG